jgi:hypothetical protein
MKAKMAALQARRRKFSQSAWTQGGPVETALDRGSPQDLLEARRDQDRENLPEVEDASE